MLSDKTIRTDLGQNPGMIIGKDEMTKFLDFVETLAKKATKTQKPIKMS
ncbi:MAG: hypothetical protein HWE30_17385 [Methylocystaceae bacterium]|nr:hypothetical protein [Methylocystaceae bacterium]